MSDTALLDGIPDSIPLDISHSGIQENRIFMVEY